MNKHKITQGGERKNTQSILGVNKHKITQDGQHIYTINTRREQAQNNSRRATHIHNQYLA